MPEHGARADPGWCASIAPRRSGMSSTARKSDSTVPASARPRRDQEPAAPTPLQNRGSIQLKAWPNRSAARGGEPDPTNAGAKKRRSTAERVVREIEGDKGRLTSGPGKAGRNQDEKTMSRMRHPPRDFFVLAKNGLHEGRAGNGHSRGRGGRSRWRDGEIAKMNARRERPEHPSRRRNRRRHHRGHQGNRRRDAYTTIANDSVNHRPSHPDDDNGRPIHSTIMCVGACQAAAVAERGRVGRGTRSGVSFPFQGSVVSSLGGKDAIAERFPR